METLDLFSQFRATRLLASLEEAMSLEFLLASDQLKESPEALSAITRDLDRVMGMIYPEAIWIQTVVSQHPGPLYKILTEGLADPIINPKSRDAILRKLPNAKTFVQYVTSSVQSIINEAGIEMERVRAQEQQISANQPATAQARVSRRICLEIGLGFGAACVTLNPFAAGFTAGLAIGYGCFD